MLTQTPQEILLQPYCTPVGDEFGTPVSTDLLRDPTYKDVIQEVGDNLEAAHAIGPELDTGEAAARAIKALGCSACELNQVCAVRTTLEEKVAIGAENQAIAEKAKMIAEAPTWLKAARLNASGITTERLYTIGTDKEAAKEALENGEFANLVGTITNKRIEPYKKIQLSELNGISTIDPQRELRADAIQTKNGHTFTVVDATEGIGSKDDITDASRKEYGILCAKFVERLNAVGPDGLPQILQQDQKMQKTIRRTGNSEIYEIRMSGKNRLYFSVMKSPNGSDGPTARIVILGAHGGDASTQRAFIDSSLN